MGATTFRRTVAGLWGLIGFFIFAAIFGGKMDLLDPFSHWPTYVHATISFFLIGPGLPLAVILTILSESIPITYEAALTLFALFNILGWIMFVEVIAFIMRCLRRHRSARA
jgi:hypothetical protein